MRCKFTCESGVQTILLEVFTAPCLKGFAATLEGLRILGLQVRARAIGLSMLVRNGRTILVFPIGPPTGGKIGCEMSFKPPSVPVEQFEYLVATVCIPLKDCFPNAVHFREVKKSKGAAASHYLTGWEHFDGSIAKVPTSDVEARIMEDPRLRKECWNEIAPPLVGEESSRNIIVAMLKQSIAPPLSASTTLVTVSHGDKPKVINAVFKRADLVIEDSDAGLLRLHKVWGEHDRMPIKQVDDRIKSFEQSNIGI
jgi:hypothetical protein